MERQPWDGLRGSDDGRPKEREENMTAEKIKEIMEEECYEFFGLRMCNKEYKIGDICENSHQWFQDKLEDSCDYNEYMGCYDAGELPGTCAYKLNWDADIDTISEAIEYCKKNYGYGQNDRKLYLIAGESAEYGLDENEIIISNAVVLYF